MPNEIGFRPNLQPDGPPQEHIKINPCICGAFDGMVPLKDIRITTQSGEQHSFAGEAMMHMTSVVVTQDKEGWYYVVCAECGRESSIKCASMNGAIQL